MNLLSSFLLLITEAEAEKVVPKVELSAATEAGYYTVAQWIMHAVKWVLNIFGLEHHPTLVTVLYAALVFLIAICIGQVVKWIILMIVDHLSKILKYDIYTRLRDMKFFSKTCRIVPAIVFLIFLQFTMTGRASLGSWLSRLTWIYIIFVVSVSINTLAMVIYSHIDSRENKKKLPLRGLLQLIKGIVWILAIIIVVAIIVNKSPGSLLAGLGAFAAVLMLVFKDSILGVVAGVQLSENDSLHVGDWIKVPGTDANGNVIEVTLTSVKVQNFDKTVTTLPPYSLVSGSFTNYRPMQESQTRRICRSYMIDADSIRPIDDDLLAEYAKLPLLADWIKKKIAQRDAGKIENVFNSEGLVDGSIETNLGVFRAYLKLYLDANAHISHDPADDCFLSTLAQTSQGIPLQLYCFTTTSKWLAYEAIQSSIFEHVAVMMAHFGLFTNENASGRDTILNGILEAGANPNFFTGLPYPFLQHGGTPTDPAQGYPGDSAKAPQAPSTPAK
ncbi:MAG: mechanosensitive ion channel family protein [Muribaculaceae bacterium]|nr:mechanosensitive ion channel family protein [Muribaculaceae bacterium]